MRKRKERLPRRARASAVVVLALGLPIGGLAAGCELVAEFDRDLLVTGAPCASDAECDDGNVCTADRCGAASRCELIAVADGPIAQQTPADCRVNQCVGGLLQEGAFDGADVFDDLNSCTQDVCNAETFETNHLPAAFQTACDDGAGHSGQCGCVVDDLFAECPAGETIMCQIACTGSTAGECDDEQFCTDDSCNTASGFCAREWRAGEPLPEAEQTPNDCRLLQCGMEGTGHESVPDNLDAPLSDDNVCTDDVCEAGTPVHRGNDEPCDDGAFCNGDDKCQPRANPLEGGSCDYHPGDPCPGPNGDDNCSESCNEASDDCTAADPEGSACHDGQYCNGTDTCSGGSCGVHSGNPCPGPDGDDDCSESCNESSDNCSGNDPNGTSCDNGQYCDGTDTCSSGSCSHAGNPCPTDYSDSDCIGTCNESADNCSSPEPPGSPCDDGQYCTTTHSCNASGQCVGTGNPCPTDYSDSDCIGTCNESANNCSGPEPSGSACNDNLYCTGVDTCNSSGSCANHAGSPCLASYGDADCSGSCRESADDCAGPEPEGSPCDDSLYCNGTDSCNSSGSCANHTGDPCQGLLQTCVNGDAVDHCHEGCNETADNCTALSPAGTPCHAGTVCNDYCTAGGSCLESG